MENPFFYACALTAVLLFVSAGLDFSCHEERPTRPPIRLLFDRRFYMENALPNICAFYDSQGHKREGSPQCTASLLQSATESETPTPAFSLRTMKTLDPCLFLHQAVQ
jgi:hypothetical protein